MRVGVIASKVSRNNNLYLTCYGGAAADSKTKIFEFYFAEFLKMVSIYVENVIYIYINQ